MMKDRTRKYSILSVVIVYSILATSLLLNVVNTQQVEYMQLDTCLQELVSSDITTFDNTTSGTTNSSNSSDGYISLYEYETFINERYYNNCSNNVIVTESTVQWEAFTLLACHSCLMDVPFIDTIPDCCLPFNTSQININLLLTALPDNAINSINKFNVTQMNWIEKICSTVDAAAVADECYTVPPTTSPIIDFTTDNEGSNGDGDSATAGIDESIEICVQEIVDIDSDTAQKSNNTVPGSTNETITIDGVVKDQQNVGLITKTEFELVLQRLSVYVNNSTQQQLADAPQCAVNANRYIIDAAYINLACASCTTTNIGATSRTSNTNNYNDTTRSLQQLPDLSCCTNPNTSITILNDVAAYNDSIRKSNTSSSNDDIQDSTNTTVVITPFLQRICTTMYSMIDCSNDDTIPTFTPTITPTISKLPTNVNTTVPSGILPPTMIAPISTLPPVTDSNNNNTNTSTTTTTTTAPGSPPTATTEPPSSNSIDLQPPVSSSSVQSSPSKYYFVFFTMIVLYMN
jgi:hypothetical protein